MLRISSSSAAFSGLQAAQLRLNTSAHNIANLNTSDFRRQSVAQQAQSNGGVSATVQTASQSGASLEQDVVEQLSASSAFKANLQVFRSHNRMLGSLLDEKA
jgi:flagellar hook-associated protein FlgK